MRTGVAHGEGLSSAVAPDHEGNLQKSRFDHFMAANPVGGQDAIPEAMQHERVGSLPLGRFFRHMSV